jgi:hypothetical protein
LFSREPVDDKVSSRERRSAVQAAQCDSRGHHSGLALLSALLKEAKSEMGSDVQISERIAKKIFYAVCLWDYFFTAARPSLL